MIKRCVISDILEPEISRGNRLRVAAGLAPLLLLMLATNSALLARETGATPHEAVTAAQFDPMAFFVGSTHGEGCLKIMLASCRRTIVEGVGHLEDDGTLVLDQEVTEGSKPTKHRQWRLRQTSAQRYEGSLTDASGPTTAIVDGDTLHVWFLMRRGFRAEQWLKLSTDGMSVANSMTISKFGVVVAKLDKNIFKLRDPKK